MSRMEAVKPLGGPASVEAEHQEEELQEEM